MDIVYRRSQFLICRRTTMLNKTTYNFIQITCNHNSYKECWIAFYIWRTIPFILITVGTCGNLLNFVVLSRKRIRKYSTTVYLLFLAGSDLVVLWTGIALDTRESISGIRVSDMTAFTCKAVRFLTMTSAGFSVWLLVLMTLERIVLTKLHLSAAHKMTPRLAIIVSTITLAFVVMFTSHLLFGYHLIEMDIPFQTNATQSEKSYKCTFTSKEYEIFYSRTWGLLILLFLNVIPILIILLGNITIAVTILQRRKKLRPVNSETSGNATRNAHQRKSPTRTLFVISGVFLVTTLPYCLYLVVRSGLNELDEQSLAKHQLINAVIIMLVYSNFTFNFFLYFVSGTLFKQEWQKLVTEVRRRISGVVRRTRNQTETIHM